MTFIIKTLLSTFVLFFIGFLGGFWVSALALVLLNVILFSNGFSSFCSGFLALGSVWAGYAWYQSQNTSLLIHERIADLFTLNSGLMILTIGIIGALIGGVSAYLGFAIRSVNKKPNKVYY